DLVRLHCDGRVVLLKSVSGGGVKRGPAFVVGRVDVSAVGDERFERVDGSGMRAGSGGDQRGPTARRHVVYVPAGVDLGDQVVVVSLEGVEEERVVVEEIVGLALGRVRGHSPAGVWHELGRVGDGDDAGPLDVDGDAAVGGDAGHRDHVLV